MHGEGPHRWDAQGRGYRDRMHRGDHTEGMHRGGAMQRVCRREPVLTGNQPVLEIHWFPWEVIALSLKIADGKRQRRTRDVREECVSHR